MNIKAFLSGAAFAAIVAVGPAGAGDLLVNGGFENGNFSGWSWTGDADFTGVGYDPSFAEGGSFYVYAGGPIGSDGYLSQSFADTAGAALTVSGWINGDGAGYSEVGLYWDGAPVVFLSPVPATDGWERISAVVTATGFDTFAVGFRDDPSYVFLDNFAVSTPELSTWTMTLAGFAGLGFAALSARRRPGNPA